MKLSGYPRALRRSLKFERHSSKVVCEEFVLNRSLVASPFINNNNNNFIYIALKSNNCPKRYLITKKNIYICKKI